MPGRVPAPVGWTGFGVFPPKTPRERATNGVLGEPVTWLAARVAAADHPSAGGDSEGARSVRVSYDSQRHGFSSTPFLWAEHRVGPVGRPQIG